MVCAVAADWAMPRLPLSELWLHRRPDIRHFCPTETSTSGRAEVQPCPFAACATDMFGILNDIRHRVAPATGLASHGSRFRHGGTADDPRLQRHRCRWAYPRAIGSVGQ